MQNQQNLPSDTQAPLISFIIPYYNIPQQWVHECIDSIMALSLQPSEYEIIIIDDGSETAPFQPESNLENRIIYVKQENKGLSEVRNLGMRVASGKYIQFIDADDALIPTPYEHCIDIIRQQAPDILFFDFTRKKQDAFEAYKETSSMTGCYFMRTQNIHGSACCYLFKRTLPGELRFTLGIYHEDEEFTPQLILRADTVIRSNAKSYFYRKHEDSIITRNTEQHRLKRLDDMKHILFRLNNLSDALPTEERTALQRRVHQLTMDYLYETILLTRSHHNLNQRIAELEAEGLFPLPKRNYTTKYSWFRQLVNTKTGRAFLLRILPFMKKEQ
jgi:glycosyltransferase involved in cell wall biosynthesis